MGAYLCFKPDNGRTQFIAWARKFQRVKDNLINKKKRGGSQILMNQT
jgi:hypothetical protein